MSFSKIISGQNKTYKVDVSDLNLKKGNGKELTTIEIGALTGKESSFILQHGALQNVDQTKDFRQYDEIKEKLTAMMMIKKKNKKFDWLQYQEIDYPTETKIRNRVFEAVGLKTREMLNEELLGSKNKKRKEDFFGGFENEDDKSKVKKK